MPERYKVISIFAGCGGLDLGFVGGFEFLEKYYPKTNFDIIWANDFDKDAQNTYQLNRHYLGDHPLDPRNIWDVAPEEIPDCDVLLAGFPCQPFSNAGNRKGIKDPRGTLFVACENIIRDMVERTAGRFPKAFVFENVRGITSCKVDDGTSVPEEIKKRMRALGFSTGYKLFKTSDYGVPQQRYRVIFVGTRRPSPEFDFRLMDEVVKIHSLPSERDGSLSLCLGSALVSIPEDAANRNDVWYLSESARYMISRIGKCSGNFEFFNKLSKEVKDRFSLPEEYLKGRSWKNVNPDELPPRFRRIYDNPQTYRAPNFYRRFALGEICGTITASAQPENCGIVHPLEDRRFSIREIARLQSFPDDFKFVNGSLIPPYKIIGNAVPPVFAWVIGQALQKYLLANDEKYEITVEATASERPGIQLSLFPCQ